MDADVATKSKSEFLATMKRDTVHANECDNGHVARACELTRPAAEGLLIKIQQSAQHLLGIINDILDFSKKEAGKLTVETIDFDLEKVLANVSNLIADKASAKELELILIFNRPSQPI